MTRDNQKDFDALEAAACRALEALAAIRSDNVAKGNRLCGTIECPTCQGPLTYWGVEVGRRREIHWRAKCTTPGCVEFIQ